MPSLSPGTPGAKEAYGIAILRNDYSICIPSKALKRYNITNNDLVLLTSTRKGEGGLAVLNYNYAKQTVFSQIIQQINDIDLLVYIKSRPYALTKVLQNRVFLNNDFMEACNLKISDKLLVIKSTTIAMSFSPVEIWKIKFLKRGFTEAVKNLEKLDIF